MAVSETRIVPRDIAEEMKQSYLDYAMSVIVSRALPDVRDGLKPVQRRILYAMGEAGNTPDRPYRKSAKTVGEVLGNYHPHGDAAVYDALVRMAQDFTLRYPLVDGHGNMGSVDGDPPAAMRYCVTGETLVVTEAGLVRMDRLAREGEEDVRLRVLSMGGKVNTASKWFDCGAFPTWRVRTSRGYEVTGTANHPLLACVRGEDGRTAFVWKTISEIKPGDWLVLDRSGLLWPEEEVDLRGYHPDPRSHSSAVREHALPSHMDEDLAFILGALVAGGTFRRYVVEFTSTPGEFADAFRSAWERVFPTCRLHTFLRNPTGCGCKPFWQMRVISGPVIAFLRNLGLVGKSGGHLVPDAVLRSPRAVTAAFLRGLYEGRGSLERSGRSLLRIGLCSKNRALLRQVQVLLLRFGIASTLSRDRARGTYRLGAVGRDNLSRFEEHIGFVSAGKRETLDGALGAHSGTVFSRTDYVPFLVDFVRAHARRGHREWLARHDFGRPERLVATLPRLREAQPVDAGRRVEELARLNYLFDRVTAVQETGEQRVYSIRVDSPCHSFVANGFINHNTEARLSRLAMELLRDLDKDTVDFQPNFDGTTTEPVVLPARFPNLLVNGSSGIAVGMATNIPPHNLGEVIDAAVALIDNPQLATLDLMRIVRGPDFPTGGLILGREGIARAYETGRGTITLRARATIEEGRGGRWRIVVTELPYEVNKARLLERIAELVRDRKVEGVADLRDETDRSGTRVVVELARGANAQVVLNQLYHHTQMQVNYGIIMLALVDGQPRVLTLREALLHYVEHQREVVTRRSRFELARAEERAHILEGLRIALNHIDAVIALIRASHTPEEARAGLVEQFGLSERQAQAILDMRLQRLTGLEREKIEEEYEEVQRAIEYLRAVLASERMLLEVIKKELLQVKERFADARRTQVTAAAAELDLEDLVADEPNVVTLSYGGYVKRLPLDTYRSQQRGGRGIIGMTTRQEDFVADIYVASTLDWLLFFTSRGRVYRLRVHELPEAGRAARGTALVNLLPLEEGEKVQAVVPVRGFEELARAEDGRGTPEAGEPAGEEAGPAPAGPYLFLATRRGFVKRTALAEFASLRRGGMIALILEEGDELIGARLTDGKRDVALITRRGLSICFPEEEVRPMGRAARGVHGIALEEGDEVVVLELAGDGDLLVVTAGGYGKRTPWSEYRRQGRGGKGIKTLRVTARNGPIVAARSVGERDEVLLITARGVVTRQAVAGISRQGRDTQGVLLMRLEPGDSVVAMARVEAGD